MDIHTFDDLLQAARQQPEPQRLLFVFASSSVREDANPAQRARWEQGLGGELTPVLCVDKKPQELAGFAQLVEESRPLGQPWHVVFVGAMADHSAYLPENDDVDAALTQMVRMIRQGTVGGLLPFDRHGDPLVFGTL